MRPSTEVKVMSTATHLLCLLVGLAFAGVCCFLLYRDTAEPGPLHTTHIALFLGGAIFGILLALPRQVFPVVQRIVVIVTPFIPVIGGRRQGDPPASGGAP